MPKKIFFWNQFIFDWPTRGEINTSVGGCFGAWGVGGKHVCVDLTGVSPIVGLRLEILPLDRQS
jgi:hypothetical protein